METVQAFLKVSSSPTRANFLTLLTSPLVLIVHILCFLGVNVFCNRVYIFLLEFAQLFFARASARPGKFINLATLMIRPSALVSREIIEVFIQ